jgi:O-antigen ligase
VVVVLFLREMSEPARRRLLAAVAAAAVLVAIFSIGYLAGALPRPSFLLDGSASSRVSQAPKLWDAFKSNPILGDGFGAVIRPKFIRDPAAPWSYELTYLQILFQTGVVGLVAILSLPLAAAWRGLRSSLAPRLDAEELAGGMAIGGVLLASATNPYLLSSFGMLSIAIGISMLDSVAAGDARRLRAAESDAATAGRLRS